MKFLSRLFVSTLAFALVAQADLAFGDDDSTALLIQNGARGDGVTDDTVAFQVSVNQTKAGGRFLVPVGKYVISSAIVIKKPLTIYGAGLGSQIYSSGNNALFQFMNVNGAAVRDLYLGSGGTQPTASLLEFFNSHHNQVNNVTMLGGYYGLHLKGSLLNTMIDLRSGTNIGGFFAPTSTNYTWVMAESYNNISANANTFIAPVLEGGTNGIVLTDTAAQGSLNITGGTVEGVSGSGIIFNNTFLPSSITSLHFEANGVADLVIHASSNIRVENIVSDKQISLIGDSRNVSITDSIAQNISIDIGDAKYPLGSGAKRILLENITTCWAGGTSVITPPPTKRVMPLTQVVCTASPEDALASADGRFHRTSGRHCSSRLWRLATAAGQPRRQKRGGRAA